MVIFMYITINKKHIVLGLIICFVFACSICLVYNNIFASKTNWGLSFKEQGLAPSGNATTNFLKQYNSYLMLDINLLVHIILIYFYKSYLYHN